MAQMNGGRALVRALVSHGVDTVFGIPGVHTNQIYDALLDSPIRHITTRHEQGAAFMADGYARAGGRPGVCVLITGPGVANAATPLGQAYSDSVPVLCISSENTTYEMGRGKGLLHESKDQKAMMESICAYSLLIESPRAAAEGVAGAFAAFGTQRPRPVHLGVPLDVLDAVAEVPDDAFAPLPRTRPAPDPAAVAEAVAMLRKARRPVILAGGGVVGAAGQLRAVVELAGAAVLPSAAAKGVLPDDHPLSLGSRHRQPAVRTWVEQADLVLAVGTELSITDHGPRHLDLRGRMIHIDLDAGAFGRNYRPDLAIHADAALALGELADALGPEPLPGAAERTAVAQAVLAEAVEAERAQGGVYREVLGALRTSLARNAIVAGDMTRVAYIAVTELPMYTPRSFLFPRGFGTLGYAMPAAIGAKLACPDRQVVVLAGDGGFLFTLSELAVAVMYRLPIPIIVCNNNSYDAVRQSQEMAFGPRRTHGVDLVNPDFVALGRAFGCDSVRVERPAADLPAVLARALAADGPTLIEVPV